MAKQHEGTHTELGQAWWQDYQAPALPQLAQGPTFHRVASEYVNNQQRRSNASTRNADTSPVVKHLLPFFAYRDAGRSEPQGPRA
jgi:hypothetical protein